VALGGGLAVEGAGTLAFAAATWLTAPRESARRAYAGIYRSGGGTPRRVLTVLRLLADRDGDGYSATLGGGDCDDADPRAFPLGPVDCEGLLHPRAPGPRPPLPAAAPLGDAVRPIDRLLVITIDSLRCDLDGNRLCPALDAEAASATWRGEQRVFMAQTKRSLGAMFGGPYIVPGEVAQERPSYLLERAREAGYRSKAFYSWSQFDVPSIAGYFDERDEALSRPPPGKTVFEDVSSRRLTDRVLADLEAHRADPSKRLLWAHYLDPHETYVATDEDEPLPLVTFDRKRAFSIEVRRTEAQVARLVREARRLGFDRNAAIVVTGDHGESFASGHLYHGSASTEVELTVPLLVWLGDAEGRARALPLAKVAAQRDLAALLAALVGAPPPPGQPRISLIAAPGAGDEQYVVVDDGWKLVYHRQASYQELYHLPDDPAEARDLADERPDEIARLRVVLAQELRPMFEWAE
jgi:hypothetical protein